MNPISCFVHLILFLLLFHDLLILWTILRANLVTFHSCLPSQPKCCSLHHFNLSLLDVFEVKTKKSKCIISKGFCFHFVFSKSFSANLPFTNRIMARNAWPFNVLMPPFAKTAQYVTAHCSVINKACRCLCSLRDLELALFVPDPWTRLRASLREPLKRIWWRIMGFSSFCSFSILFNDLARVRLQREEKILVMEFRDFVLRLPLLGSTLHFLM